MRVYSAVLHVTFGHAICCVEGDALHFPQVLLWIWRFQTLLHLQYDIIRNGFRPAGVSADAGL